VNLAPSPLYIFCKSLRHEGSNRIVLPDEADNPVSGEWIRAQMNDEVESALNKELKEKVKKISSPSSYVNELSLRTQPRGGLLGDDRVYHAVQDWRSTALIKLWQLLRLELSPAKRQSVASLQKGLAQIQHLQASPRWLVRVVKLQNTTTDATWILDPDGIYSAALEPALSSQEKEILANSLKTWLIVNICRSGRGWKKDLESSFPCDAWSAAVLMEQYYHRAYLASLLYEWAWPEREDPPATQPELERLLTEGPLQAEIRPGEFGQFVDESWMQIVDYAVVDLPTGRLVRALRPGLLVAGRVVRKAHVVISR
jgi:hypothetical protein